jgi:hypothetical protein
MKAGDRVLILQSKYISGLKHLANHPAQGIITSRNGGYIYVQPDVCSWGIEAYECELEIISK